MKSKIQQSLSTPSTREGKGRRIKLFLKTEQELAGRRPLGQLAESLKRKRKKRNQKVAEIVNASARQEKGGWPIRGGCNRDEKKNLWISVS